MLGHGLHPHTRAHTPNRTGPGVGGGAPTTCGHECSSIQGALEPKTFLSNFLFQFYLKFCFDFFEIFYSVITLSGSARELHDRVQIWSETVTTDELQEFINSFSQFSLFTAKILQCPSSSSKFLSYKILIRFLLVISPRNYITYG